MATLALKAIHSLSNCLSSSPFIADFFIWKVQVKIGESYPRDLSNGISMPLLIHKRVQMVNSKLSKIYPKWKKENFYQFQRYNMILKPNANYKLRKMELIVLFSSDSLANLSSYQLLDTYYFKYLSTILNFALSYPSNCATEVVKYFLHIFLYQEKSTKNQG